MYEEIQLNKNNKKSIANLAKILNILSAKKTYK
jgi:hypothetical protein